jgi:hypothetical protein
MLPLPLYGSLPIRTKHTIGPPPDAKASAAAASGFGTGDDSFVLLRAISAAARAEDDAASLCSFLNGPPPLDREGMTIKEAAAWLGVDHRTLGAHLTVIPPGPVPPLPPGKVPARLIGNVRRIFKADVLGLFHFQGGAHEHRLEEASSGSRWHRQVDQLRQRGAAG